MITHNMKQALELGSRTLMMDAGRIVLDVRGEAAGRASRWRTCSAGSGPAGKGPGQQHRILLSGE